MKQAIIFLTAIIFSTVNADASEMFNDGSDFMKGFETGIMMRAKQGKLEDFGCVIPDDFDNENKEVFDMITGALNTVKAFLPKDNIELKHGFALINEFISGLQYFMIVLSDDAEEILDMYCRGMVFGLKGSTLLVRMANMVRTADKETAAQKAVQTQNGAKKQQGQRKKSGSDDILGGLGKGLGDILSGAIKGIAEGFADASKRPEADL